MMLPSVPVKLFLRDVIKTREGQVAAVLLVGTSLHARQCFKVNDIENMGLNFGSQIGLAFTWQMRLCALMSIIHSRGSEMSIAFVANKLTTIISRCKLRRLRLNWVQMLSVLDLDIYVDVLDKCHELII